MLPGFPRPSHLWAGLLGCVALVSSGCGSTAFEDPDQALRRDLQALRSQIVELQKKSVVSEVEILRLREKVAELEAADQRAQEQLRQAEARPAAAPSPPATRQPVVRAPMPAAVEVTDLDDFGVERPAATRDVAEAATEAVSASAPGDEPTAAGDSDVLPSDLTPAANEPLDDAAQALYDRGFTEYHEGRYLEAETSLQRFLEGFPNSQWSDNALYWIGEARFARRDYRGALAAFRETANRYPEGNKVPDALLKAGQALEQLGDVRSARQSYEEVSRRFPDTATALIAEERLRQLER